MDRPGKAAATSKKPSKPRRCITQLTHTARLAGRGSCRAKLRIRSNPARPKRANPTPNLDSHKRTPRTERSFRQKQTVRRSRNQNDEKQPRIDTNGHELIPL